MINKEKSAKASATQHSFRSECISVVPFSKILIANRGEIAVRIIRACREMDIRSVLVYSTADADSMAVRMADEAVCIGPPRSAQSYPCIDRILSVAALCDVSAIHPGYGFLSENAYFAEACQKHGMKLGLYYSQDQDWHEKDGGGYRIPWVPQRSWTNDWDFPENDKKDYSRVFETKIKTQMKEILTNYGELCLIWCDNPYTMTDEQSLELYEMIRKYQPNALVNSRIGNGRGDYCSVPDNAVEYDLEEDRKRGFTLFECPATLNDTWGYKSFDANWKSADKLFEIKESLNARGINYLLNVGPDHLGRIPAPSIDILHELGNKIRG